MAMRRRFVVEVSCSLVAAILATSSLTAAARSIKAPTDPGVRGGGPGAGKPLPGLTADETAFFNDGLARFAEIEVVTGAATMDWGRASIPISACLAIRSRRQAAPVLPKTP